MPKTLFEYSFERIRLISSSSALPLSKASRKAVRKAISIYGTPEIINSDQGSQFTSDDYTECLKSMTIGQSMDGKGRWV